MDKETAAEAMQAAVAAAAELAKNGGMSLFVELTKPSGADVKRETSPSGLCRGTENSKAKATVSNDKPSSSLESPSDNDSMVDGEEDAEDKLARSRERNREHARRTRLRKKAQLEALQEKVQSLQSESKLLRQSLEECSIATILLGISSGGLKNEVADALLNASKVECNSPKVALAVGGKRKRFISEDAEEKQPQPLKLNIDGQITLIGGGKTHINWKSGLYCNESGVQTQLTHEQLETLRRERNRMHAKMTRDRKKCFIAAIEKNIEELESHNKRMREVLTKVAEQHTLTQTVTPVQSPAVKPKPEYLSIPEIIQEEQISSPALVSILPKPV